MGIINIRSSDSLEETGSENGTKEEDKSDEAYTGDIEEVKELVAEETPDEAKPKPAETSSTAEKLDKEPEETVAETPVEEKASEEEKISALTLEENRLRKQIEELRKERRGLREEKPLVVPATKEDAPLEGVHPDDAAVIEKVLRAKGYVRKDELVQETYKEKVETFKEAWLVKHPEYLPANDPEDKRWSQLQGTINSYFKAPPDPKDIEKVLDAAHAMIAPSASFPTQTKAQVDASKEKLKSVSKTSSSGTSPSPASKKGTVINSQYLQGFTDEELREMAN